MRSITFYGITITTTTTPYMHLINDIFYDTDEVLISEYNINEVLNIHNGDFNYNTKKNYTLLLQHMAQIIDEMGYFTFNIRDYCVKYKFCFSICKDNSHKNPYNHLALIKDIEIVFDNVEESFDMLLNKLEDIVNDMNGREICINKELNEGLILKVIKIERINENENENIRDINENKTFKPDTCIICVDNVPNVIYCNCGHIPTCSECDKILENKTVCLFCKHINKTKRVL